MSGDAAHNSCRPVTELLHSVAAGDPAAREQLWAVVYHELRAVAQHQLATERSPHSLHPTTLVSETYLRLFGNGHVAWTNRRHFFAAAAIAMRRIRVDDARRRCRLKRGGGGASAPAMGVLPRSAAGAGQGPPVAERVARSGEARPWPDGEPSAPPDRPTATGRAGRVDLADGPAVFDQDPAEVLAIAEALDRLEQLDPRKAEVVSLRYFVGLTVDETAVVLGVSPRTIDSEWRFARAWLHHALTG